MKKESIYLIGFIGGSDRRRVRAHSVKEAKELFAQYHGIKVSGYIVASKWTAEMMNKYLNHDDKLTIDWYAVEKGYPYAEDRDMWKVFDVGLGLA
jgi:hypothetical protein